MSIAASRPLEGFGQVQSLPHATELKARFPSLVSRLATPCLIAILAVSAHGRAIFNGFIWDDDAYVTANKTLRSADGLRQIWLEPRSIPQYYPLVHTTYWLEFRLWGLDPRGYHAVNVLLHAATAAVLYGVFRQLGIPVPWLGAALFAVHPLGVESVSWVTERKNTLSLLLATAAAAAWFGWRFGAEGRRGRGLWLGLAIGLFALAMLAKTVAAMLVPMLLIATWWKTGRIGRADLLGVAPLIAIGLPMAAFTVWLEKNHVGADDVDWQLSPAARLVLAGRAVWFYAQKLVWPHPLAFFYERWQIDPTQPSQWVGSLLVAATVGILWWQRHRIGRGPLAGTLAFMAGLFPAIGFFDVFPFKYSFVADHFAYHSLPAGLAAVSAGLVGLCAWARVPVAGPAAAVLAALAALTAARTGVFVGQDTLYRDTLAKTPSCSIAANNLGAWYLETGRPRDSIELLTRAAATANFADERSRSLANLARAFLQLDENDRAYAAAVAARTARDSQSSRSVLARACVRVGRLTQAESVIAACSASQTRGPDLQLTLGELALAHDDLPAARAHFRTCLDACDEPARDKATLEIAIACLQHGLIAEAETHVATLDGSQKTAATAARGWMNVAVAYARRQEFATAIERCQRAAVLDPTSAEVAATLRRLLVARRGE